jgi:hypothetical protein
MKLFIILLFFCSCSSYTYYFSDDTKPIIQKKIPQVNMIGFKEYEFSSLDYRYMFHYNKKNLDKDSIKTESRIYLSHLFILMGLIRTYINSKLTDFKFSKDNYFSFPKKVKEENLKSLLLEHSKITRDILVENCLYTANCLNEMIPLSRYSIIGSFEPPQDYNTFEGKILTYITYPISLLSFYNIPNIDYINSKLHIGIYDKELNKIKELKYEKKYFTINSWWIRFFKNKNTSSLSFSGKVVPNFYYDNLYNQFIDDLEIEKIERFCKEVNCASLE